MKKKLAILLAFTLIVVQLIPSIDVEAKSKVKVKSVKVTNVKSKKLSMEVGENFTLKTKVSVKSDKKSYQKVKYTSSNKKVAKVSSKGKITARKAGKATITVTSKKNRKKKVKIKVTVNEKVITSIKLDKKAITLKEGDEYQLESSIKPSSFKNEDLYWYSSNEEVADVDDEGMVYAEEVGTAVITAEADDAGGKKATCKVTVIENPEFDEDDEEEEVYEEEATPQPTQVPTIVPTASPTVAPTVSPTAQPTAIPTLPPVLPTIAPVATATPTVEPTIVPTATPIPTPVNQFTYENIQYTVDEEETYSIVLSSLNETTLTSYDKRPEAEYVSDYVAWDTFYNRDGSVTWTSAKDYNSGLSFYINPCTSTEDIYDISDIRGEEGYSAYLAGTRDMFAYDYIRIRVTSKVEMNLRTYCGNEVLTMQNFPGGCHSETYEQNWIGPTEMSEYLRENEAGKEGMDVTEEYITRTLFVPMIDIIERYKNTKGDLTQLTAIAICPQRGNEEVTLHSVDFVKVNYNIPVTEVEVIADKTELDNGKATQVTTSIAPENATRKIVKWTSSNEELATVDANGLVVAAENGYGTVTITANATDGSGVAGSVDIVIGSPIEEVVVETHKMDLTDANIIAKTNPGEGEAILATQSENRIEFKDAGTMLFVNFSAYLEANQLELANYTEIQVTWEVQDGEGNAITEWGEEENIPQYGKIAFTSAENLNGYSSGIDVKYEGEEDTTENTMWLTSPYVGQTCVLTIAKTNPIELATVDGFNLQLGAMPTGYKVVIKDITLYLDPTATPTPTLTPTPAATSTPILEVTPTPTVAPEATVDHIISLDASGVYGYTNPGDGAPVPASHSATSIWFGYNKNMGYVNFSEYLSRNQISLASYDCIEISYRVVMSNEENVITSNTATNWGKIALVPAEKLNGYDSGINRWLIGEDGDFCSATKTIDLKEQDAETISAIAGFNLQLSAIPEGCNMIITGIVLIAEGPEIEATATPAATSVPTPTPGVSTDENFICTSPVLSHTMVLDGEGLTATTNAYDLGDENVHMSATQSATQIDFVANGLMHFVNWQDYLELNEIDLSQYDGLELSYAIVDENGDVITENNAESEYGLYGKVMLADEESLTGWTEGFYHEYTTSADGENYLCEGVKMVEFDEIEEDEFSQIAGFNLQFGGIPENTHVVIRSIRFVKDNNAAITLNADGVVAKANPGDGESVLATQSAAAIIFEKNTTMVFVDLKEYLTVNNIDLTTFNGMEINYKVVDEEGNAIESNPDATYGKIALVSSDNLNGYGSGYNKWLSTDEARCAGTKIFDFSTREAEEIAAIAGFNIQLASVPENCHIEVTQIRLF